MTTDPMQFPQQFPPGYPMMNPYGQGYIPQPDMIGNFAQQPQFPPDMIHMYMQLQMQNIAPPGAPVPNPLVVPKGEPPQAAHSPEERRDSGNDTLTPPPVAMQPNMSFSPNHVSPHVSPHFQPPPMHQQMGQMTPTPPPPIPQSPHHQTPIQQPQQSEVSPYAINTLLSAQTSPENVEKEDMSARRNTYPSTMPVNRKRRAETEQKPQMIPQNFTNNYTPMMMHNFAALMNQSVYQRRDVCQICGDNATGYHYGVMSCEGCKGFFRRSVHKKVEYVCQKGAECAFSFENCAMNRGLRTRCQACRFKRCIQMGMNKESVKVVKDEKTLKNPKEEGPETTSEIKELVDAFILTMPSSTNFTSPTHAIGALKKFIQSVPQLASAFPKEDKEMDFLIQGIMSGFLVIRAAFTFDPIGFIQNGQLEQRINLLRMGIRNSVFTDGEVALLSGIYILQTVTGASSNIFPMYCQGLRDYFAQSHPREVGIYDRILSKLGPSLIQ